MAPHEIKKLLQPLPSLPGVYRYFNKEGELIYVGKAKNLRKRVASYFTKKPESRKARHLVEGIHHLEFTIVNTEREALLLENSLIKNYQPRYNINLKDDKSYPYIVIKNEPFPRIFLTRNIIKDGSEYYGPFTNIGKTRGLLELIRTLVPIRTNNHNLFIRTTDEGNLRVNPQYYMKEFTDQNEEILTEEDYEKGVQKVREILKGKLTPLTTVLNHQIKESVKTLEFERAAILRQKLEFIQEYDTSNVVANAKIRDVDVFTHGIKDSEVYVNYLRVRKGNIVQTETVVFKKEKGKSEEEILTSAIVRLQKKRQYQVNELIVPFFIDYPDPAITITVPKRGIKRKLMDLSRKNLIYFTEKVIQYQ